MKAAPRLCRPFLFSNPPPRKKSEWRGAARREGGTRGTPRVAGFRRSERTMQFQATTHAERAKSVPLEKGSRKGYDYTAKKRNRILEPKWGRAGGATLKHSPQKILNLKGFSTLRVAQKVRFDLSFKSSNRLFLTNEYFPHFFGSLPIPH